MGIQLQVFKFEEENRLADLATVEIDGAVWFVAQDVCNLLDIKNVADAVSSLDVDEKLVSIVPRAGQVRSVNLVSESGLYALVFRSKKPSAVKFRKWVTKVVLPAIRKTGTFTGEVDNKIPTYSTRILSEPTKTVTRGYWSIFDRSHKVMLLVEKYVGSVNQYDLVDGSIGLRWNAFRSGKDWAEDVKMYDHVYTDNRGPRSCKSYHRSELEHFENWLEDEYIPKHLYKYLYDKYKKEKNAGMLGRVDNILPHLLN